MKRNRIKDLTQETFNNKKIAIKTLKDSTSFSSAKIYKTLGMSAPTGRVIEKYTWDEYLVYKQKNAEANRARKNNKTKAVLESDSPELLTLAQKIDLIDSKINFLVNVALDEKRS